MKSDKLYEGMYIVSATLSEEARQKALERIEKGISDRKGKVVKVHEQGKKRLAYGIEGHREGYYYLLYFELEPAGVEELWKEYLLNEDLIRFITLRTEKVMETMEFKPIGEQR